MKKNIYKKDFYDDMELNVMSMSMKEEGLALVIQILRLRMKQVS